jgi:CTP:phosphocholine cytidylyltransferase-like protein
MKLYWHPAMQVMYKVVLVLNDTYTRKNAKYTLLRKSRQIDGFFIITKIHFLKRPTFRPLSDRIKIIETE